MKENSIVKHDTNFNGKDSFLASDYLRRRLKKPRYLIEFERGEQIIAQWEPVEDCYFLDKGSVMIYELDKGKRRILDSFSPGTFLLSEHIMADFPSVYYLEAREKTALYSISLVKLHQLVEKDSKFTAAVLAQETRNVLVCMDLLRKNITHSASWLVSDFLLVMALRSGQRADDIIYLGERMTQKEIADMLYMNRITCFRELHNLENLGLIDMQTNRIGIKNLEGLAAYRESCDLNE